MLDFTFYSGKKETLDTMAMPNDFYEWLSKSEFPRIGKAEKQEMTGDGEAVEVSAIPLEGENRRKFSNFFRDEIVHESDKMLNKLGDSPSKNEYMKHSSRLKTLQELRKLMEDEKNKYFAPTD